MIDLSIAVSFSNVGLILTKLRRIQLFSTGQNTCQNSISTFLEKKFKLERMLFSTNASPTQRHYYFPKIVTNSKNGFEI